MISRCFGIHWAKSGALVLHTLYLFVFLQPLRVLTLLFLLFSTQFLYATNMFVSLRSSEVNMRVGPGKEYPVSWVFMRANLPMLLIAEFDQWRKVKYMDGTTGWIHKNMISHRNCAIVLQNYAIVYRGASKKYPILKLEKGVVVKLSKRDGDFVKVEINNMKGWVEKKFLWGINDE